MVCIPFGKKFVVLVDKLYIKLKTGGQRKKRLVGEWDGEKKTERI